MKPLETYERCVICDWFELDPFNVAPHKRHVVDGVCHVCRGAIQSTLHTPSLDLPDPFEGSIGGALLEDDRTPPRRMPLEAPMVAVHGDLGGAQYPYSQAETQALEVPLNGSIDKVPSAVS